MFTKVTILSDSMKLLLKCLGNVCFLEYASHGFNYKKNPNLPNIYFQSQILKQWKNVVGLATNFFKMDCL